MTKIKGTVGLLLDDKGNIKVHHADFNQSKPGGFKLEDAQESRVKDSIANIFLKEYCFAPIAEALDNYTQLTIINALIKKNSWKLEFIHINQEI